MEEVTTNQLSIISDTTDIYLHLGDPSSFSEQGLAGTCLHKTMGHFSSLAFPLNMTYDKTFCKQKCSSPCEFSRQIPEFTFLILTGAACKALGMGQTLKMGYGYCKIVIAFLRLVLAFRERYNFCKAQVGEIAMTMWQLWQQVVNFISFNQGFEPISDTCNIGPHITEIKIIFVCLLTTLKSLGFTLSPGQLTIWIVVQNYFPLSSAHNHRSGFVPY